MRLGLSRDRLSLLTEAIRAVEMRSTGPVQPRSGAEASVGRVCGGDPTDLITPGRIHEWMAGEDGPMRGSGCGEWPPLCVIVHAAQRMLRAARERGETRHCLWIGRRCWARASMLGDAVSRCVFVDPPDVGARLWALDAALRCPGVGVVVADGSGLDMAASRRLQLAAETGGVTGLIVRPACERSVLSAAFTRWLVTSTPTSSSRPRWTVDLLRCKGLRPTSEASRRFVVEWNHVEGALVVPAELGCGTGEPSGEIESFPARAAG